MSHEPSPEGSEHPARPAAAPAFALLTSDGYAVASTDIFTRLVGLDALSSPAATAAVAEITSGRAEQVAFTVPLSAGGEAGARVEAVNDAQERLTLLEVAVPRPGGAPQEITAWFARFGDDSGAIIWLKDLEGRYLSVNGQYTEQLGVEPARICGRTDAELSQFEAIDGPRSKRVGGPEPAQLEYVIPAFDRRPAYTALRFPLSDATGAPIAVCGVASPADQADVANAECERLLAVRDWLQGDPVSLRRAVLSQWGITTLQSQPGRVPAPALAAPLPSAAAAPPPVAAPAPAPAGSAQLPAEFTQLLQSLQRQVTDLEAKVTSPPASPSAAAEPTEAANRFAIEQERRRHAAEVERLDAKLGDLHDKMLSLSEQLRASQAQVLELQAALEAAREQMTRLERAAAAATAAAAAAASPIVGPAPTPAGNLPGRSTAPVSELPVAARLSWDAAAQEALSVGLRGCLNVRSIFSEAVRLIGTAGGWDVVVAWLPDEPDGRLGCAATWVRSPVELAALETSMWQVPQSPTGSAVGSAATTGEFAWINDLGQVSDPHLVHLGDAALGTVVLLPVRREGRSIAVLELASTGRALRSPAVEAALRSIESEVAAAHQRVTDTASASQWGRRSR